MTVAASEAGSTNAGQHVNQRRKRHARLIDDPLAKVLWVDDPADWALIRHQDSWGRLVCPVPGCDIKLVSVETPKNLKTPRFFRFKNEIRTCDHTQSDHGLGGGPETLKHKWLKSRLESIVLSLHYTVEQEQYPTRADVYVHEPSYSLEVQLASGTDYKKRTDARNELSSDVCWLIPESLDSQRDRDALFGLPAVRFMVYDTRQAAWPPRRQPVFPWDHPDDHDLNCNASLLVFATVGRRLQDDERLDSPSSGTPWFKTHSMDGKEFLDEILSGRRRWHPQGRFGNTHGLWILDDDIEFERALRARPGPPTTQTPPPVDTAPPAWPPLPVAGSPPIAAPTDPPPLVPQVPDRTPDAGATTLTKRRSWWRRWLRRRRTFEI